MRRFCFFSMVVLVCAWCLDSSIACDKRRDCMPAYGMPSGSGHYILSWFKYMCLPSRRASFAAIRVRVKRCKFGMAIQRRLRGKPRCRSRIVEWLVVPSIFVPRVPWCLFCLLFVVWLCKELLPTTLPIGCIDPPMTGIFAGEGRA